jgi:proliferating cell nuclear antigen PCNA
MKITISEPHKVSQFSTIFHHLKQFSDNIVIYFNLDRFYIQGLDGCQCCLFECELTSQWFDVYEFDTLRDQPSIGVNTGIFHKIIGTRHKDQIIELMVEPTSNNLGINFVSSTEDNLDRFFEIPLIEINADLMEIPPSDTTVDLTMSTMKFQELISQMSLFNSEIVFKFCEDKINLNASGNEGSMRTEIKFGDVHEYAVAEDTELIQSYSLKYISMMCNFHKLNPDELCMGFSETRPMHVKYNLDDDSYVSFYLAPKMEN